MSQWLDEQTLRFIKSRTLDEKAALMRRLVREPGWALLKHSFQPEMRTRITDSDDREAFLYEAIRTQVILEIFGQPEKLMQQALKRSRSQTLSHTDLPALDLPHSVLLWDAERDIPSP